MTAQDLLWDAALDQHGFVTLSDARRLGISRDAVTMLARRGKLEQVATAVYRFPRFQSGPAAPYMLAVLWTGEPRACLSHDTALAAYDVSDVNPERVHLTVPPGRRIRRSRGDLYTVHHENLADDEIGWWEEVPTVTLATAIRQCIDGGVPTYLLGQALDRAAEAGRISAADAQSLTLRLNERT